MSGESREDLARHLSFFVPAGFTLTKTSEIDRLHNEAEAWRVKAEGRTPDDTCPLCGRSGHA